MKYSFNLTPKQAQAYTLLLDNTTTEIGYGGGAGGGKSYLGCFWILSQCLAYPGVRYVMGRKELTNLKKTTLATFFKLVRELGLNQDELFKLNSMTNTIRFTNTSEIILMDMAYKPSDPEYLRFGGLELTGAFVDESNESEEKALSILKTRIGRCLNKELNIKPKLLETFNPSKNHVYFRYYKPFKAKTLKDHIDFIPALVTDNPYLDDTYIDQLRKADKITRERLLYGNFEYDDDPSKLFEFDAINDLFTNNPLASKPEAEFTKYCTVDVARYGKDLTVIMLWKDLYVYRIIYFYKNSTKELVDYLEPLCQKEKIGRSNVVVDEDGVGGGVVDFFEGCKGFVNNSRAIEVPNPVYKRNYANLKAQCYFAAADSVNARLTGVYSTGEETVRNKLIEDLEQVRRKNPDKDEPIRLVGKEELKEILGRSPDFGDAFMMRWIWEIQQKSVFALI